MPPRRRFDKKNAKTFSVVHRAHDDALFYDEDASAHVLVPVSQKQASQKSSYTAQDLKSKLTKEELDTVRENEGLAAQYGIFFDDSKYDYMQHLKPIGESQDAVFISAKDQVQSKPKTNIEDLFKDQLPSEDKIKPSADYTENIPKELQGFNPNMDPRLREVLEALDDEAYLEETEDGVDLDDILKSGGVDNESDYYEYSDEDYDEWDLDNYEEEYDEKYGEESADALYNEGEAPSELKGENIVVDNQWQNDFMKFKKQSKNDKNDWDSDDDFGSENENEKEVEEEDKLAELPQIQPKKKSGTKARKKKGAMTDTTSFSMSSSALFRTEGLTLLDDRYEQYSKRYSKDEEKVPEKFDMTKERGDFEDMLDDFLDNYELESGGRKLAKKNEEATKLKEAAQSVSRSTKTAKKKDINSAFSKLQI
ncbi:putative low-temperature viability protein [Scheffersomyces coipomensis]|uniref:putative low-temperature viability protein n=1 Tax=Scheffersomyces coipomensis TaxID=1788519 RepID=UPI00315DE36D